MSPMLWTRMCWSIEEEPGRVVRPPWSRMYDWTWYLWQVDTTITRLGFTIVEGMYVLHLGLVALSSVYVHSEWNMYVHDNIFKGWVEVAQCRCRRSQDQVLDKAPETINKGILAGWHFITSKNVILPRTMQQEHNESLTRLQWDKWDKCMNDSSLCCINIYSLLVFLSAFAVYYYYH